jgi:S1-C subfamily serine protease
MNIRRVTVALGSAALMGLPLGLAEVPHPDFDKITKSVLNVTADNCAGQQPKQATGFVWNNPNTVVTALHAVAGCKNLSVNFEDQKPWPATVTRVFIKADLALLAIKGAPPLPVMSESNVQLQTDQDLWSWGFQEGAPSSSERKFSKLSGSKTLRKFINPDLAAEIDRVGMPDLDFEIIYVSGLAPGLSGAPIFDLSGAVVGIGDGGLNGGSVGINWALPQKYLGDLLRSSDKKEDAPRKLSAHQFSFDRPPVSTTGLNCGGRIFTQFPDINLASAIRGTDDPSGLTGLTNFYGIQHPEVITFHVYTDLNSGATFVLPAGAIVSGGASGCTAQVPNSPISFTIALAHYTSRDQAGSIMGFGFSQDVLGEMPPEWKLDPQFISQPRIPRLDGFEAQRVGTIRVDQFSGQPDQFAFRTVAIKRGTFLGVSVRVDAAYILNPQVQSCFQNRFQGCQSIQLNNWINSKLAIHLATFGFG